MEAKRVRSALGRGLNALVSTPVSVKPPVSYIPVAPVNIENESTDVRYLSLSTIVNNPKQPRQTFSAEQLAELADSIKQHGVLQPILVRPTSNGEFEIVAGERRYRAAKQAQLTQVPVIIKKIEDREAFEIALIENIQRSDLSCIEEAKGYERLASEFSLSQEQIAERVGKSRSVVANLTRLLKLPEQVLELLETKELSTGHAKVLLSVREPSAQISLAKKVVKDNLSVRALELLCSQIVVLDIGKRTSAAEVKTDHTPVFPEVIERLRRSLGTKVAIRHLKGGRGRIEIEYFSEEELGRIVDQIAPV